MVEMGLQCLLEGGATRTVPDLLQQLIPDVRSSHSKGSVTKFIQVKRRLIQCQSVHCRSYGNIGFGACILLKFGREIFWGSSM